jgi:hypothetical protein
MIVSFPHPAILHVLVSPTSTVAVEVGLEDFSTIKICRALAELGARVPSLPLKSLATLPVLTRTHRPEACLTVETPRSLPKG